MPNNNSSRSQWWREDELAREWRLSTKVLQKWRRNQAGPAYYKLEGAIRYRLEDIEAFEAKNRRIAPNDDESGSKQCMTGGFDANINN